MPYKCTLKNGKYQLITKATGKVHGTHDSLEDCIQQMKAIYVHTKKEIKKK